MISNLLSSVRRCFNFVSQSYWLVLWLTVIWVGLLAILQASPVLADPDSFYHLRAATLIRDSGLLRSFPWTQFSLYKNLYIDHHLGYHLLLIPFVSYWSEIVGLKIATVFFAGLTGLALFGLLKKWQVPNWGWSLLLLAGTAPFLVRQSLGKAPALAVALTLLGYYLISERRLWWWAALSWLFVWFYSAWPLLLVIVVVETLVLSANDFFTKRRRGLACLLNGNNYKLWLATLGGLAAGLLTNPYFPQNIFYLERLFNMAIRPYHDWLAIGAEWYPYPITELLANAALPLGLWIMFSLGGVVAYRQLTKRTVTTWLLSLIFLIYTGRARRQVEYLVPFLVLSSGLLWRDCRMVWRQLINRRQEFLPRLLSGRIFMFGLIGYLMLATAAGAIIGYGSAYYYLRSGFTSVTLQPAVNWLSQNTPANSLVWQTDWGTFPVLWYHSRHNYYLTGLDQTFMYAYNPELYRAWYDLVTAKRHDDYQVIHDLFKADYVLLEKRKAAMLYDLNRDGRFKQFYQDKEVIIFKVEYD